MKITKQEFMDNFNFTDDKVISALFNHEEKTYFIELTGVSKNSSNGWVDIQAVALLITNWKSLKATRSDPRYKEFSILNKIDYEPLEWMLEFKFEDDFYLAGFGKISGKWIEYYFEQPKVEILLQDQKYQIY